MHAHQQLHVNGSFEKSSLYDSNSEQQTGQSLKLLFVLQISHILFDDSLHTTNVISPTISSALNEKSNPKEFVLGMGVLSGNDHAN